MIMIRAVLLGILQALTEFFPFSNTSHITLLKHLFHYRQTYMAYDIVIDAGTVLAICIYYAGDLLKMIKHAPLLLKVPFMKNKSEVFWEYPHVLTLSLILVSTCATAASRFIFKEAGDSLNTWPMGMGMIWIIMGMLIFATRKMKAGFRSAFEMNHQDAFLIGLAQGLTVFPGVARAGITIVIALYLGISRKESARYSYLLALPYILCALLYKLYSGAHFYQSDQGALLVSFVVSILAGVVVLAASVKVLEKGKYFLFSFYCFAIGIFSILLSTFPGIGF